MVWQRTYVCKKKKMIKIKRACRIKNEFAKSFDNITIITFRWINRFKIDQRFGRRNNNSRSRILSAKAKRKFSATRPDSDLRQGQFDRVSYRPYACTAVSAEHSKSEDHYRGNGVKLDNNITRKVSAIDGGLPQSRRARARHQ